MRALALCCLVSCAAGPRPETARWPSHRHRHDDQLDLLEKKNAELERRVTELEHRLAAMLAPAPAP